MVVCPKVFWWYCNVFFLALLACGFVFQGAEIVAFVSVNDVYVMRAWEEAQGAKGKVLMLSDGNGDLAAAVRAGVQ